MFRFLNKIKCFLNFHSWNYYPWDYYPGFNYSIYRNTIYMFCKHCDAKKTIKKNAFKCIYDWKKIISTNRSGKPICATLFCIKCNKTIIK